MIYYIRSILILVFVLILSLSATAQTQKRVINLFDANEDAEQFLELVDIQIDGKSIVFGKPFKADESWLKDLKIRVKNISGKPLVCFGLPFGLVEGIKQELEPYASYRYGFAFSYGKPIEPVCNYFRRFFAGLAESRKSESSLRLSAAILRNSSTARGTD